MDSFALMWYCATRLVVLLLHIEHMFHCNVVQCLFTDFHSSTVTVSDPACPITCVPKAKLQIDYQKRRQLQSKVDEAGVFIYMKYKSHLALWADYKPTTKSGIVSIVGAAVYTCSQPSFPASFLITRQLSAFESLIWGICRFHDHSSL